MNPDFWNGRRVFVTGHTGFKGGWLVLWLRRVGADVTGFALAPATDPSLFEAARTGDGIRSVIADVRDPAAVGAALHESGAEIVFHLAAQSLVRASYLDPAGTYATNVMGTVHVLEAIRTAGSVRAAVIVTSDKCYENREWPWPYREADRLGGRDPYSNSKACAELVTSAYRSSFFSGGGAAKVATVRAGNVIGGGDWAKDRLVPDLLRAFAAGEQAVIRNPEAVRPWQHVLEPLHGYILLAEALLSRSALADSWNFGPHDADVREVRWVADHLASRWGDGASWTADAGTHPHEARTLRLDSSRARAELGWVPRLSLETALDWVIEWQRAWLGAPGEAREITLRQMARYETRPA
jgi:CDP-glucose 4,6-dehydratase